MSSKKSFLLRMDVDLHERVEKRSLLIGKSINQFCDFALRQALFNIDQNSVGDLIDKISQELKKNFIGVILFGSQARGSATKSSDVDLLIVIGHEINIDRSLYRQLKLDELNSKLSPHLVHLPKEMHALGSLWLEVSLDGKVLYDADGSVQNLLTEIRHLIAQGEYQRFQVHGHGYWKNYEK